MKYVLAGCAIALCTGSAALASDQLARQLGVEPGVYTLAQLTEIKAAQEDSEHHDALRLKWAMKQGGSDVVISTQSMSSDRDMAAQLARQLHVKPGVYTLAQLTEIKAAREEHDPLRLKHAMARTADVVVSTQSMAPARQMTQQLGAAIRVDPSEYSLSDLVAEFLDETS